MLVLDQSASIVYEKPYYDNWNVHVRGFAKDIVDAFPIGANLTQVGLMKFNESTEIEFHLDEYEDREPLRNAIDNLDYHAGDTNIAGALRTAREVSCCCTIMHLSLIHI